MSYSSCCFTGIHFAGGHILLDDCHIGGHLLYEDRFCWTDVLEEVMYCMRACLAGGHIQLEYV